MHHAGALQPSRIGWLRRVIAVIGAWIIYRLIWIFGRTYRRTDVDWLLAPIGGSVIGDATYGQVAEREGLSIERHARRSGRHLQSSG